MIKPEAFAEKKITHTAIVINIIFTNQSRLTWYGGLARINWAQTRSIIQSEKINIRSVILQGNIFDSTIRCHIDGGSNKTGSADQFTLPDL